MSYENIETTLEEIKEAIENLKAEENTYSTKLRLDEEAEEYANILQEYTKVKPKRLLRLTDYGYVVGYFFKFRECHINIENTPYGEEPWEFSIIGTIYVGNNPQTDFELDDGINKAIKTCLLRDSIAEYVKIDF